MMNVLQGDNEGLWDIPSPVCSFRCGNDTKCVENLLELSSWENYSVENHIKSIILNDWNEATSRWGDIAPNASYQVRRRKKSNIQQNSPRNKSGTDSDYDWVYCLLAKDEIALTDTALKPQLRPLKAEPWEDSVSSFMGVSLWKASVEPRTYRYIHNNGVYRAIKFLKDTSDWYTVNKRKPERVSSSLQQKQIKQEIKKQLEYHEKQCRARSSAPECSSKLKKSSPSSGAYSAPAIIKSTSDVYIQNFSSRLSALDEEIRKDSKLMRSSHEDIPKSVPIPGIRKEPFVKKDSDISSGQLSINSTLKEHQCFSNTIKTPRELLSIKQFTKIYPLRPIDKSSFHYKKSDESNNSKQSCDLNTKHSRDSGNGSHGENISVKNSFPADSFISGSKVTGGYRHKLEPERSQILSEVSNSKPNDETDPEVNYSVKSLNSVISSSKVSPKPRGSASVCVEDNTSKVITDSFIASPVGRPKDRDIRQSSAKMSTSASRAILPEISGKKLEVSMTNHRWL